MLELHEDENVTILDLGAEPMAEERVRPPVVRRIRYKGVRDWKRKTEPDLPWLSVDSRNDVDRRLERMKKEGMWWCCWRQRRRPGFMRRCTIAWWYVVVVRQGWKVR